MFTAAFTVIFTNLWIGTLGGDESLYALLARQILNSGNWLVLHHPYEWKNFYEHPPLYMWITAINFKLFGISDFSAKLFSAFSGAGTVIVLYYTGRILGGHKKGLFSASILLTTIYFLDYSRKARLEVPITFFMILSFYFLLLALNNKKYVWSLLSGAATALAFLSKGVPAFATIPLAFVAFIFDEDVKSYRYRQVAFYMLGIGLFVIPWALMNIIYDKGAFFNWYINKQLLWSMSGRSETSTHIPLVSGFSLYYIKKLILEVMLPWIPFAVLGTIRIIRKSGRIDKQLFLTLLMGGIIILAFSFVSFKKTRYILPALPFLSLLAAEAFTDYKWTEKVSHWFSGILAVIILVVIILSFFLPERLYNKTDGDLVSLTSRIHKSSMPGDTVLVYGLKEYTVSHVFTWYFDRPQKICVNNSEFKRRLSSENYKIAIEKVDREIIPADIPKGFTIIERGKFNLIYNSADQ